MKKSKKKFSIGRLLIYISLILTVFVCLLPIVVVFFASFKTGAEMETVAPVALPKSFLNFANYKEAFVDGQMLLAFGNTVFILVFSILATVFTGTMTAYVLNRFDFKGRKLINGLFLTASLIPSITMQMTIFQIISKIGLFNTRWSTILLFAGTDIISIYIFVQFLENIPVALDEAAVMEGASYWQIFMKILFPLLKPATVTVIIIKGVGFYNEFYTPYLYMPDPKLKVIATSLYAFMGPYSSKWQVICAGVIITVIPTLILFLLLQKQIYQGMTAGAVKE